MNKKRGHKKPNIIVSFFSTVLGMVVSLLIQLYLIPYLPFVTNSYWQYLPVGITTAILTSFLEFLRHTTTLNSMKQVFKLAHHAISLYGLYYLIRIFPFDFGLINMAYLNQTLLLAFCVAVFGIAVAILVDFVKLAISTLSRQ